MKHIIERFLKMDTAEVFKAFSELPGAKVTRNYVFIKGIRDKPILLVGHADTVFSGPPGSVEWCGNLAKAGYQWSSKANAGPTTKPPAATKPPEPKKKEEKVTVVQPETGVIIPTTGIEAVTSFAIANGYTVTYLPDIKFWKNKKDMTYDQFVQANMATQFKSGRVPKDPNAAQVKLTRDDVKRFAVLKGYNAFHRNGDVKGGELCFMSRSNTEVITFEKFCMEHATELLRLKDDKNNLPPNDAADYLSPTKRGVYSLAEKRKIEDAVNALPDAGHRALTRSVVDELEDAGLLVTPETIEKAGERWAIAHPVQQTQANAVLDTVKKSIEAGVKTVTDIINAVADPYLPATEKPTTAMMGPAKPKIYTLLHGTYKGFDPDDVLAFAKDLNFNTISSYSQDDCKTISFQRNTTRYSWIPFVDKFSFGIEFERDQRLSSHKAMWPFGEDKKGKAREDLIRKFAKDKGWDSDFGGGQMNFTDRLTKEILKLDEFILRHIDSLEITMGKLDAEFKDADEKKVSKNSLKKVSKLVNRMKADLDVEAGTVTVGNTTYTIHAFRQMYDKKYAASSEKKSSVKATTSVVKSASANTGYSRAMDGSDWGEDWGYGYGTGGLGSSNYGSGRGLGADDRVGIAMIWMMRKSGHSILITDGEERGGIGAKAAGRELAKEIGEHQFAIEIDRNFDQEMVFYQVGTQAFKEYMVEQTGGFHIGIGSYTDIADVCEAGGICGVNLAAGYWNQHTSSEMFSYDAWLRTYNVVRAMLYDREHPRFPLPKYEPPKHGSVSKSNTGTSVPAPGEGTTREYVMDAASEGDKNPNTIAEDWLYDEVERAFFPPTINSTSSVVTGQDDDLTTRDMPPSDMSTMQADGADEVQAEAALKARGTKNQSMKGLGVPATDDQQHLLTLHAEMV
jgi:hypothetical protein